MFGDVDFGGGVVTWVQSNVVAWKGCDKVIEDAAQLPFEPNTFDTVSYLACLNHIPNRNDSVRDVYRVLKPNGKIIVTMITPRLGAFIHWLRFHNDPDHKERHIDHSHELLGMSEKQVTQILTNASFTNIQRKRFAYGLNSIYIAVKKPN